MKIAKNGQALGKLENEIMKIIWQSEFPLSVRDVMTLLQKKRTIAYTTVMTVMGRLTEKGVLSRKLYGSSYLYEPKVNREKFVSSYVHNMFKTAVSTLGQEAVTHFIKEIQKLSPERRNKLIKMLDQK
ncbi:MAG: BlaI/MecI/CopY family transcriptional regulator [Actinobacteria bacterium]|nr:BlaI/MecI/CopY family transcriptional regulator [Actinomycetota bacterium]